MTLENGEKMKTEALGGVRKGARRKDRREGADHRSASSTLASQVHARSTLDLEGEKKR